MIKSLKSETPLFRRKDGITMGEPLRKIESGENTVWITQPNEVETLLKRREIAFNVAREKLGLEIINSFKEINENKGKYLLIDSLSNMIIYNDPEIVTEFFYHLVNKTRARNIHTISLAIEEEG